MTDFSFTISGDTFFQGNAPGGLYPGIYVAGGTTDITSGSAIRFVGSTDLAFNLLPVEANVLTFPDTEFDAQTFVTLGLARSLPDGATDAQQPIQLNIELSASISLLPPPLEITEFEANALRIVPRVVVTLPEPVIVNGRPMLPTNVIQLASSATSVEGAGHIRAIADPDPKWNPATSGWFEPAVVPSGGVGDSRWTVNSLPDPNAYRSGYYWLGDQSSQDGTIGIQSGARQWAADPSTGGPSWQSIFPYKPSVRNHVHYGPHGQITTTKGVRFNLQFVEHMWMDFGHAVRQPFTWVIVGLVMDYPSSRYVHTILDSGRDPRAVGYPYLSASNIPYISNINDGLSYRNLMQVNINSQIMGTEINPTGGHRITTPFNMVARPRMFFGIYNGANSYVGNYSNDGKHITKGKLAATGDHRFYVMGRQHGYIGLDRASHLVVFEMRVWHHALTLAELNGQYGQLASAWKFNQY